MLESQYGLTPSRDTITSAINRDLQINPETPQFARSYLQSVAKNLPNQKPTYQPTMMEEFYNNLDKRVTGPNVVPNASDLAIQAKTFNTPEALMGIAGATQPGMVYGTNLSKQGKVLEDFRRAATKFKSAPANPANTPQAALNFMTDRPGLYGDIIENKDFIQGAINQGFLGDPSDYENQVSLDQIDLKDGGLATMFVEKR